MKRFLKKYLEAKLALWARRVIERYRPEIIAITGSIAKTSAKEVIYQVLAKRFGSKVGRSPGNLNSETGLPLAILGFRRSYSAWLWPVIYVVAWWRSWWPRHCPDYLILEMGADKVGDIRHLVTIAPPKVAVVTAVGPSHLSQFKSVAGVAKEKADLIRSLPKDGVAVLNKSDQYVAAMAKETLAHVVFFTANGANIARQAAKAVGELYQVPEGQIEEVLAGLGEMAGRMRVVVGPKGCVILDDSYNANPLSMAAALQELVRLGQEKQRRRKIAILGDMLDLGDYAPQAHQEVMAAAKQMTDYVVGVGESFKRENPDRWFAKQEGVSSWLLNEIKEGDIILIKGSHGIRLDKLVDQLIKER